MEDQPRFGLELPVSMSTGTWGGSGRLHIQQGCLEVTATGLLLVMGDPGTIRHTASDLMVVCPRVPLPPAGVAVFFGKPDQYEARVTVSVFRRRSLVEALRQAGFQVRIEKTWFSLGLRHLPVRSRPLSRVESSVDSHGLQSSQRRLRLWRALGVGLAILTLAATASVAADAGSGSRIGIVVGAALGCMAGVSLGLLHSRGYTATGRGRTIESATFVSVAILAIVLALLVPGTIPGLISIGGVATGISVATFSTEKLRHP